jgi:undecaprenol kinase
MIQIIKRLYKSFQVAISGLWIAAKEEPTFRVGAIITIIVLFFMFYFPLTLAERAIIVLTTLSVLGMEALNTQVERTTNLIDGNHNIQIRKIKDLAAGAVLLLVLAAAFVAGFIFIPHILNLFN